MRYGVISDLHSNWEALEAVLAVLREQKAGAFVCCGDLVGYGPDPDRVLERVAALPGLLCVNGNHDLAVLARMDLDWFNENAKAAVLWTRRTLRQPGKDFMGALAPRAENADLTVVHGSPRSPAEEYLLSSEQYLANIRHFKTSPCFIGHSHLPVYFTQLPDGRVQGGYLKEGQTLELGGKGPWIINPGAVGQPRDGDPRASCGLYDSKAQTFQLLRVAYDVAGVQSKIRKAGLPEMLAARLSYGE